MEGPKRRSGVDKGTEVLLGYSVGERVLDSVRANGKVDAVVYCGEAARKRDGVDYVPASEEKFFFKTLDNGFLRLDNDESAIVIGSDLPLVAENHVGEMLEKDPELPGLHLFFTTNSDIQTRFPSYNPNKRYARFREGEIVFANAFIVQKGVWTKISRLLNGALEGGNAKIAGLLSILKYVPPGLAVRILAHSNIRRLDSWWFMDVLKGLPQPSLHEEVVPLLSRNLGVRVTAQPVSPEFAVDYDRRHQRDFFENVLRK